MGIMTHEEWMRRTKLGAFKPRSGPLKFLDAAVKEYGRNPGSPGHLETLKAAFIAWAETKDGGNAEDTERNHAGAITDLMNQILDFERTHRPAAHLRATGLLRDIRQGAQLMAQGKLKPQVKVKVTPGDVYTAYGHVVFEDFDSASLQRAKKGWEDAYNAAEHAVMGMARIGTDSAEQDRFNKWFGRPTEDRIRTVKGGVQKLMNAFKHNKVTIANREDIQVHLVNGADPYGQMTPHFTGGGVYGYVWQGGNASAADGHQGSGYRIIMGKWFLGDPDPIEGAAQTIYHELTHKVLRTVDHGYGKIKSRGFATMQPDKALQNADNWAFYAVSFLKEI